MNWPTDTQNDLEAFYGKHRLNVEGIPTRSWENTNLVGISMPYPLTLAWDMTKKIKKVRCHRHVAESLQRILDGILKHYGSPEEVRRARMDLSAAATTSVASAEAVG